jgi:DNA-3-methyladenine glycosylase II
MHDAQQRLNSERYASTVRRLCRQDEDFRNVVRAHGPPPFWHRPPGYQTLIHIILEQQVSLASAKAVLNRLKQRCRPLNPANFLRLTARDLSACGFSRQKMRYCRVLSESIRDRELSLRALHRLDDDAFRKRITEYPGIGPWTSDVYLLIALARPDVWPSGDLALLVAMQSLKRMRKRPSTDRFEKMGNPWRPDRSTAARILWHHYLNRSSK